MSPPNKDACCKKCRHADVVPEGQPGCAWVSCRHDAPRVGGNLWPSTRPGDWCSRFEPCQDPVEQGKKALLTLAEMEIAIMGHYERPNGELVVIESPFAKAVAERIAAASKAKALGKNS